MIVQLSWIGGKGAVTVDDDDNETVVLLLINKFSNASVSLLPVCLALRASKMAATLRLMRQLSQAT